MIARGSARWDAAPAASTGFALLRRIAWAVLIIIFSVLRPDTFAQLQTFKTIFGTQAVSLILGVSVERIPFRDSFGRVGGS